MMSKKIIAISLALVVIIACFTACGKKYETTKINGKDVILVTDENGEPIVNDKNELIALVTDKAGEVLTYADGEDQTHYIKLYNTLEIDDVAYGEHYRLDVLKGWETTNGPRLNKEGTEGKCFIEFTETYTLKDNEVFEEAFIKTDEANDEIQKAFEDETKIKELIKENPALAKYEGCKYIIESNMMSFTGESFPCKTYVYKVVNADGGLENYVNSYYFLVGETIYCISYSCVDGVGYDESFDFAAYLRDHFTFVK